MRHPALSRIEHRPLPLPARPWQWRQNWLDVLFIHWPIATSELRPLVPAGLTIQEHAGTAWVSVVPFRMTGVMRRPWPDVPGLSAFNELNVRLYVERDGVAGVLFLSLDANQRLAVWAARRWFHLPYYFCRIDYDWKSSERWYLADRVGGSVRFEARFQPQGTPTEAAAGSLEAFLTERYCLYAAAPDGQILRCDVHHWRWQLQPAVGDIDAASLLASHGLEVGSNAPLLHFSAGVRSVVWPLVVT